MGKAETSYGGFDNSNSVEVPEKVALLSPDIEGPGIKVPGFYVMAGTPNVVIFPSPRAQNELRFTKERFSRIGPLRGFKRSLTSAT